MIRKIILILLTSFFFGCGNQKSLSSFIGLGNSPSHFHKELGKETRKNKPSVLHDKFTMDEYFDVNEYRYRVSYMNDSAELITIVRIDGNPLSDAELDTLLNKFNGGKQWHHRHTFPDGGKLWQRDDAAAAKYSPSGKLPSLELMTTKTLKLFMVQQ
ncbi:MAG: hypothetical protein PF692_06750 [Kiritimatiellae bacterium]|jgi:hypothetical protein|nr:hypothetical protein [Kiritimatiellia bacterium]